MKLCVNGHLVDDFKEERTRVAAVKNGKCGYINAKGEEVVAFVYDKPAEFEPLHDFVKDLLLLKRMVFVDTLIKKVKAFLIISTGILLEKYIKERFYEKVS